MAKKLVPLLLTLLLSQIALAAGSTIKVEKAWARATTAPGATGVVYLTLENTGSVPDRLIGVTTPVAATASLHVMVMDGNMMMMRPVDAVDIKQGQEIDLRPNGLHIMLTNVRERLQEGGEFPLQLDFEKAGTISVEIKVLSLGAKGYP